MFAELSTLLFYYTACLFRVDFYEGYIKMMRTKNNFLLKLV